MPWPLGTGFVQTRLKELLGIRGPIPLELDESIVPVISLMDVERGPVSYPIAGTCSRADAAAAANFSAVGVKANGGSILVVDRVLVFNRAGVSADFVVGYDSNPAADAETNIIAVNLPPVSTSNRFLAATCFDRTQAAQMVSPSDFLMRIPAGEALWVEGPPWVLYSPPGLNRAVVVSPNGQNTAVEASFIVREYESP